MSSPTRARRAFTPGLEMAGAGAHLPAHAGNPDPMTATAVHLAERVTAER